MSHQTGRAHSILTQSALTIYLVAVNLLAPLVGLLLLPWLLFSRKRRITLLPRLGLQRFPEADKRSATAEQRPLDPIWVHALSVGELLSCVPLLKELRMLLPPRPLYLSISTLAAHELATEKLAAEVDGLFYLPYDLLLPVRRCLSKIQPALFLLIETDIWPGFLAAMRRRHIPCFLLNARLSAPSFRFSRWLSVVFRPAFATFARIYPQSMQEGQRFLDLGIDALKIHRPGNLKFDLAGPLPAPDFIAKKRRVWGIGKQDPVLLAGSTHQGEEAILRSAFFSLRENFPDLRLIIVPRHPKRAMEVAHLFVNDRLSVTLSSRTTSAKADVVVVDQIGLLGGLYALADVAFVGGSLVKRGGQNPIEPAAAGKPILFGPDMSDFPEVSRWLIEKGGAISVQGRADLVAHSRRLLADPSLATAIGRKARAVVDERQGASRRIAADIVAFLHPTQSAPVQ